MVFFHDLRKKILKSKVGTIMQNTLLKRFVLAAGFFVVLTLIMSFKFMPDRVSLEEGQVSPRDFKAPTSVEYIDELETERLRKEAAVKVEPVFQREPLVNEAVNTNIDDFLAKVRDSQRLTFVPEGSTTAEELPLEQKIANLRSKIVFGLSDKVLTALLAADEPTLNTIERRTKEIFYEAYRIGIRDDALAISKSQLIQEAKKLGFRAEFEEVVIALINEYTVPNKIYNEEETQRRIDEARERVVPVQKTIKQGEIILREGEIVTKEHIFKLQALGLLKPRSSYGSLIGIALFVGVGMVLVLNYLYQSRRQIFENEAFLLLLGIIVTISLLVAKVVIAINIAGSELSGLMAYAVPMAAASMLIAILLDPRLSIMVTIVLSLFLGIMTGGQIKFAITGLVTGMAAIFSVSRLSQRSDLAKAGLTVGAAGIVSIFSMSLISNTSLSLTSISALALGAINGILSAILTIGILPYLETAFGITSAISLLELSNPNNPLLKRLLYEAPGTYHHSILVGNLAEAAADTIGAESLLCRVGALYHDIGKLKRPYFFIENQLTADNPHDRIAPSLSTLIITSHIRDGLEMADQYKLPKVVRDIIEQHHGTTLCAFFYLKAKGENQDSDINESDYRYDASKPQTKEAAIVMMADTVEAAVRSVQKPNIARIEGLVRKLIKEKLHDGQLDESDLTLKEIDKIADAFMKVLGGIFHSRIEYPDHIEREIERRKAKGDSSNK